MSPLKGPHHSILQPLSVAREYYEQKQMSYQTEPLRYIAIKLKAAINWA
jgi:hypothetical protein